MVCLALVQLLLALALQGCESAPNVRSDYDKSADFGKYRTYNFVTRPSTDKGGYSSLTTQQLEAAVGAEMQKRGYTRVPGSRSRSPPLRNEGRAARCGV